jgi:rubrerythrin
MKRCCTLLTVLLLAAAWLVAAPAPSFKVRNVLDRAVTNERDAVARYKACAAKAEEEGYPGAASLFRAAAKAEEVHAQRFVAAMKDRGLEVPQAEPAVPEIGTTGDNLRVSSSNEISERDGIYKEAIAAAREGRDEELALIFDQTRDTEVEHANLMGNAARQLEKMKSPKTYYVCSKCGFTSDIDLPFCMLCRSDKHPHEVE